MKKFRAWDVRNNFMYTQALELAETGQLVTVNVEHFNSQFSFFDGCKWMQSLGLFDVDGAEIFEGDYLETSNGYKFLVESIEEFAVHVYRNSTDIDNLKVIGDIYSTPNLI